MNKCVSCKIDFVARRTTDGRPYKRQKCFKCLPFNKNPMKAMAKSGEKFKCETCSKKYIYKRGGYNRSTKRCGACIAATARTQMRFEAIKFLGGKCKVCGYNRHKRMLVFHHVRPKIRKFRINNRYGGSWQTLKAELKKCILVCPTCHAEIHAGHHPVYLID